MTISNRTEEEQQRLNSLMRRKDVLERVQDAVVAPHSPPPLKRADC